MICGGSPSGTACTCRGPGGIAHFDQQSFANQGQRAIANQQQDVSKLSDECGRLHDENRELLVENATLRRQLARLERKPGGR